MLCSAFAEVHAAGLCAAQQCNPVDLAFRISAQTSSRSKQRSAEGGMVARARGTDAKVQKSTHQSPDSGHGLYTCCAMLRLLPELGDIACSFAKPDYHGFPHVSLFGLTHSGPYTKRPRLISHRYFHTHTHTRPTGRAYRASLASSVRLAPSECSAAVVHKCAPSRRF